LCRITNPLSAKHREARHASLNPCSEAFCYASIALTEELIEALQPLIKSSAVAPLALAACACCLEAFSLGVGDNMRLFGRIESAHRFWESFVVLVEAGMPWTYKRESMQPAIETIEEAEPDVDRIRLRIDSAWRKIHKALAESEQAEQTAAAKMACLLIDPDESRLAQSEIELFADLISNKRRLARVFVRRVRREREKRQN
jgi:hypothetical protein